MLKRRLIIHPIGARIVVEHTDELNTTNSILQMPEEPQKKHAMGIVCAVPKTFNGLKDDEKVILENLKVGQLVWFSEWAAQSLKGCEKQSIVSVKDIYAIITQEGEE